MRAYPAVRARSPHSADLITRGGPGHHVRRRRPRMAEATLVPVSPIGKWDTPSKTEGLNAPPLALREAQLLRSVSARGEMEGENFFDVSTALRSAIELSRSFSVSDRVVRVDDSHADRLPTGVIWGRW
jgi:hypothetical protein